MAQLIGHTLGSYLLTDLLGEGGYAYVYKGVHQHLGTHAAIKVLKTMMTDDEKEAFRSEARLIAHLDHPHIIRVREFGFQDGQPYLVLEYAIGSLKDRRPADRPLPLLTAVSYLKQIASALQYAHEQRKLVHRDVKPANMLILANEQVVLSDFGIALLAPNNTQAALGTPYYMAPEQIQGHPSVASDQYALGIVAYEWLSGHPPFQGRMEEIVAQHLSAAYPGLAGRVPASMDQVIGRALAKDQQQRFPRIQDFADELERAYQQESVRAQRTTLPVGLITASITPKPGEEAATEEVFTGTVPGAPPAADVTLARYHGLLTEFHRLHSLYQQNIQGIQQRFEQERQEIEASLQQEQAQADQGMGQVRQAVEMAQKTLTNGQWARVVTRAALPVQREAWQTDQDLTQADEVAENLAEVAATQTAARTESKQLIALTQTYQRHKRFYRIALQGIFWVGAVLAGCYGLYFLAGLLANAFGRPLPLLSSGQQIAFLVMLGLALGGVAGFWREEYARTARSLRLRYTNLLQTSSRVEAQGTRRNQVLQAARQSRFADTQARYTQEVQAIEQRLRGALAPCVPALQRYQREDGPVVADWTSPFWQQWWPRSQAVMTARLGAIAENPLLPPVPALVLCPERENLLIKASGAGKERAVRALQSFILRLLTMQPPGKLRLTLIDSSGLGENLATFLQLADYDPLLISGKVWTRKEQIAQQLAEISDHMENVIQQYLRNQFQTIGEYNQAAGEIAEPYRVLVVVGFPTHFTRETVDQLTHIASVGPRCGVSVVMTVDTQQPLPATVRLTELERMSRVIVEAGQDFTWQQRDLGACRLQLDQLPAPALVNHLLKRIGEQALLAQQRVEIPFRVAVERRVLPEYRWWLPEQRTSEEITAPLGQLGAAKYQSLQLGKGTAHHVLIVGTTGSGKTNLLHVLITGLSLLYHPGELEFYLIDFKTVGFTPYAHYRLPHARVIAIQSEREFGLSVLEGVKNELEERKRLFSLAHVQDIAQFRRVQPHTRMPRILLIIDEFQELFMHQDEIARAAGEHLNRFVRMGRGLGIHVILASQTLAALSSRSSILDNATLSQMTVRIAMHKERADSALILGEENAAAAQLFQLRPGEAIYNADGGAESSNRRFQSFFLADEELSLYLDAIRLLARNRPGGVRLTQRIFDGSCNAEVAENRALRSLLQATSWQDQRVPTIWLGDPVSLQEVTAFHLRPRTGSNLMVLGRDEAVASGLLTLALFALAAQHAPGKARFAILDGRADTPYVDRLRSREQELPHKVQVIGRNKLLGFLSETCDEIQDRIEEELAEPTPIYILVHGLQRLRALRLEEENGLAQRLATIAREGAEQRIHLLLWCDTLHNLARFMERPLLSEFDLRVAFHLSEHDSLQFLGSPEASGLNPYRAVFLRHGESAAEKFIPYAAPSDEWLVGAVELLRQKTC